MTQSTEKIPVLVLTDDGRDVDDIEAMTYLAGSEQVEIAGVVTTHMIPDRRAMIVRRMMENLGYAGVEIGVGSVFPLGKEDPELVKYLREHTIGGRTYEGEGLIECFPDGTDVINAKVDEYGPRLQIAALAPLTDLAKAAQENPKGFRRIGGIHIQGQAIVEDGRLHPDPAAYNLKEDMEASDIVMQFQDWVPFSFIGKHAAYQLPLDRSDFARLEATGNPVGRYMRTHAEKGIECFARRAPEVFQRVFGVPAAELSRLDELSKPYDALVAKNIAWPEGLLPAYVAAGRQAVRHTLVGMSPQEPGVRYPRSVKADLMSTMLHALRTHAPLNP